MPVTPPSSTPPGASPPTSTLAPFPRPETPVVQTALNAVTTTGASTGIALGATRSVVAIQTVITGAPTAVSVNLEVSLDGANWVPLLTCTNPAGEYHAQGPVAVRFIRANLTTLTGGSSPTVTAIVAALS